MANTGSGNTKKLSPLALETLFDAFYNAGQRRTYHEVEAYTKEQRIPDERGVSYATVRRYADEYDWTARADALDTEARAIRDKRLASELAKHRVTELRMAMALQSKFFRRLIPSTAESPNPAEIMPEELDVRDFIDAGKFIELLTGGATERTGDEGPSRLEEMERAIMEMDARDKQLAIGAGETGGS